MLLKFQLAGRRIAVLILAAGCLAAAMPQALAHGDLHERIAALTRQLERDPRNAELWLQRADALRRHGEFAAALADVAASEKLKPNQPAADLQRARVWFDAGEFPKAVRATDACLARDPVSPDALVIRARSRARLGQTAAAVKDLSAVLALDATPLPDLYLERAQWQSALGHLDAAVRGLDDGLARLGQTPSLVLPAIEYERCNGAFPAALARLEKARAFFDRESFLALRGEILLQAGRSADAEKDFQTALAAVESFPAPRRETPQTKELAARLRAGLKQAALGSETQ
jgi:tetratricopeptide (TPR) repeat protein